MKRIFLTLLSVQLTVLAVAQPSNEELISIAKIYRSNHFSNTPAASVFDKLKSMESEDLKTSTRFISELIKSNNSIATKEYLTKPDRSTLENLFIIRSINWNLANEDPIDNDKLIDSLRNSNTDYLELLACYYDMIFVSVGNKNRPLNMSQVSINLDEYNLENDTEKGILFLVSMNTFGTYIWGYMNIVNPPNYKEAMKVINSYPLYNNEPYYQYQYLNFPDFNLTIDIREPKKSFKEYYINKYLNTLLYHSLCLSQKKKYQEEKQKVMLGSIMSNESYYKYSQNREIFESIFKRVDK